MGARVVIVARVVFAEILSTHTLYADARKTVVGAVPAVGDRLAPTGTTAAILPGAHVGVGRAHDTFAGVGFAIAEQTQRRQFDGFAPLFTTTKVHTGDERNQHQRTDTQKSQ
jgi:hypothetical protein